ncbi:MAG: SurA N-terminal domain-containing protein [Deltaproteobacteria bacterium]|nr:SurA N-terminal domain-containing protein [Deltaproteobacteria bacterium]
MMGRATFATMAGKKFKKKFKEIVTWGLVIGICVVMLFMTYGNKLGKEGEEFALKVNGEHIPRTEVFQVVRRLSSIYEKYAPGQQNAQFLKNLAIEQVIRDRLKEQKARDLKLIVSDTEVREYIQNFPAFQENGVFKKDLYFKLLESNRMTHEAFEQSIRSQLQVGLLTDLLRENVKASQSELEQKYKIEHQKLQYDYAVIDGKKIATTSPKKEDVFAWLSDPQNKRKVELHYNQNKQLKYTKKVNDKEEITPLNAIELDIAHEFFLEEKALVEAQKLAGEVLKSWKEGKSHALFKIKDVELVKNKEITFKTLYFDKMGYKPELASSLFKLNVNEVYPEVVTNQSKAFILKVVSKPVIDMKEFSKKEKELLEAHLTSKSQSFEVSFTEVLRKDAEVEISPDLLK